MTLMRLWWETSDAEGEHLRWQGRGDAVFVNLY